MKRNDDIFSKPKKQRKHNPYFKYFVVSFCLFIIVLAICSAFLFMRSIDFDLSNIVERSTTEEVTRDETVTVPTYSVNELTGASNILVLVTDDERNANFGFLVSTDFSEKSMKVLPFDANINNSNGKSYKDIYSNSFISGLKAQISTDYSLNINKYIVVTESQLKKIVSSIGGVTINVTEDVNYKSSDFTLYLEKGKQKLSDEYVYRYLTISDNANKGRIMCDIINSMFSFENAEKSDDLFKTFVNNCDTDISVVDYANAKDTVNTYSKASDKFYPTVVN